MSDSYFGFDPEKVKINRRESHYDNLPPLNKETKKTEQEVKTKKRSNALVFCILLCVILYLLFLTIAFTETSNRYTYICYTTKTGECYHDRKCRYLNTAYETTVYEASKKYNPCSYCNPFYENNKTTITVTERDYLAPALISIPISAVIFLIIKKTKGDDS